MSAEIAPQDENLIRRLFLEGRGAAKAGRPVVYAMAGIPGSGKSAFVAQALANGLFPAKAFLLAPDKVMEAIPAYWRDVEYQGAQPAFDLWEMPARTLAYDMAAQAADLGYDIIKDMGCVRPENWQMLENLKNRGYRVEMHLIKCEVGEAIRRVALRSRYFPPEQVISRAAALETLLARYAHVPDALNVHDNTARHGAEGALLHGAEGALLQGAEGASLSRAEGASLGAAEDAVLQDAGSAPLVGAKSPVAPAALQKTS